MTAAASLTPVAGGGPPPAGHRLDRRLAAASLIRAACFWLGVAVGLVVEQRRGYGSEYWREQAQLAWHMRGVAARSGS